MNNSNRRERDAKSILIYIKIPEEKRTLRGKVKKER